jgi:hypothetical protein
MNMNEGMVENGFASPIETDYGRVPIRPGEYSRLTLYSYVHYVNK